MPGTGYWSQVCNTCGCLFEIGFDWEGGFCSESCYLHTLDQEDKIEYIAEKERKNAEKRIEEEMQKERVMVFLLNHKPTYKPAESTVFYWQHREKVDKFSTTFLGRWQKGKKFVMGTPIYDWVYRGPYRAETLKELERVMHNGVKYHKIIDHNGNEVSWEDFLYYSVTSEINEGEQEDRGEASKSFGNVESFINHHHHFRFVEGLRP